MKECLYQAGETGRSEAITFQQAAALITEMTGARSPHVSTLYRWALRGVRGYRLRMTRIGGKFWTTKSDLVAFLDTLNNSQKAIEPHEESSNPNRFEQQLRKSQVEAACLRLEDLCCGFPSVGGSDRISAEIVMGGVSNP